jgi:ribonuclease T1
MSPARSRITFGKAFFTSCIVFWAMTGCAPPPAGPEPEREHEHEHEHPAESPHHHRSHHHDGSREPRDNEERGRGRESPQPDHSRSKQSVPSGIPEKVGTVLRQIDEHDAAPAGYEGGRVFHNAGRDGEQALPRMDTNGRSIAYREWDVNPKVPGVNRGAERLITGSDGSAYYTSDHYRTFTKVR